MSAILALLAPYWQPIAGVLAGLAGAAGLYLKGRADAAVKAKLEDVTNANNIRKAGADARAAADVDPRRLHDDDGWRRD